MGNFIAGIGAGVTLCSLFALLLFRAMEENYHSIEEVVKAESKMLIKCEDGSTEWKPLPVCGEVSE